MMQAQHKACGVRNNSISLAQGCGQAGLLRGLDQDPLAGFVGIFVAILFF